MFGWLSFPRAADPVESLIEDERREVQAWQEPDEDLPPVATDGTATALLLYGPYDPMIGEHVLCTDLDFDEILAFQQTPSTGGDVAVNVAMPRVRERLERACLVRPGDEFTAVGPGWQRSVTLTRFVIRPAPAVCPEDPPYSLWAEFEPPLDEAPLFFSSDPEVRVGTNAFHPVTKWDRRPSEALPALVRGVADLPDYQIELFIDPVDGTLTWVRLSRRRVSLDDDTAPNEIAGWIRDNVFHSLWVERVDVKSGSGHLRFLGSLDANGDGRTDVILQGEHGGCPYRLFLDGKTDEFVPVDYPQKSCRC